MSIKDNEEYKELEEYNRKNLNLYRDERERVQRHRIALSFALSYASFVTIYAFDFWENFFIFICLAMGSYGLYEGYLYYFKGHRDIW